MLATQYFIRNGEVDDALEIAAILIGDEYDLIHKAVGWMLREVGDRNREAAQAFLAKSWRDDAAHCISLRHRALLAGRAKEADGSAIGHPSELTRFSPPVVLPRSLRVTKKISSPEPPAAI